MILKRIHHTMGKLKIEKNFCGFITYFFLHCITFSTLSACQFFKMNDGILFLVRTHIALTQCKKRREKKCISEEKKNSIAIIYLIDWKYLNCIVIIFFSSFPNIAGTQIIRSWEKWILNTWENNTAKSDEYWLKKIIKKLKWEVIFNNLCMVLKDI
jgi:hypothetical protein